MYGLRTSEPNELVVSYCACDLARTAQSTGLDRRSDDERARPRYGRDSGWVERTDRGIIDLSGVRLAAVTPAGVIPFASSFGGFVAECGGSPVGAIGEGPPSIRSRFCLSREALLWGCRGCAGVLLLCKDGREGGSKFLGLMRGVGRGEEAEARCGFQEPNKIRRFPRSDVVRLLVFSFAFTFPARYGELCKSFSAEIPLSFSHVGSTYGHYPRSRRIRCSRAKAQSAMSILNKRFGHKRG